MHLEKMHWNAIVLMLVAASLFMAGCTVASSPCCQKDFALPAHGAGICSAPDGTVYAPLEYGNAKNVNLSVRLVKCVAPAEKSEGYCEMEYRLCNTNVNVGGTCAGAGAGGDQVVGLNLLPISEDVPEGERTIKMNICNDDVPNPCTRDQCRVMLCGTQKSNYRPITSIDDATTGVNTEASPSGQSIDLSNVDLGSNSGSTEMLYQATCKVYPMTQATLNKAKKAKGALWANTFRFGVGDSFSDYEESKAYMPISDRFCTAQPIGTVDRYTNYKLPLTSRGQDQYHRPDYSMATTCFVPPAAFYCPGKEYASNNACDSGRTAGTCDGVCVPRSDFYCGTAAYGSMDLCNAAKASGTVNGYNVGKCDGQCAQVNYGVNTYMRYTGNDENQVRSACEAHNGSAECGGAGPCVVGELWSVAGARWTYPTLEQCLADGATGNRWGINNCVRGYVAVIEHPAGTNYDQNTCYPNANGCGGSCGAGMYNQFSAYCTGNIYPDGQSCDQARGYDAQNPLKCSAGVPPLSPPLSICVVAAESVFCDVPYVDKGVCEKNCATPCVAGGVPNGGRACLKNGKIYAGMSVVADNGQTVYEGPTNVCLSECSGTPDNSVLDAPVTKNVTYRIIRNANEECTYLDGSVHHLQPGQICPSDSYLDTMAMSPYVPNSFLSVKGNYAIGDKDYTLGYHCGGQNAQQDCSEGINGAPWNLEDNNGELQSKWIDSVKELNPAVYLEQFKTAPYFTDQMQNGKIVPGMHFTTAGTYVPKRDKHGAEFECESNSDCMSGYCNKQDYRRVVCINKDTGEDVPCQCDTDLTDGKVKCSMGGSGYFPGGLTHDGENVDVVNGNVVASGPLYLPDGSGYPFFKYFPTVVNNDPNFDHTHCLDQGDGNYLCPNVYGKVRYDANVGGGMYLLTAAAHAELINKVPFLRECKINPNYVNNRGSGNGNNFNYEFSARQANGDSGNICKGTFLDVNTGGTPTFVPELRTYGWCEPCTTSTIAVQKVASAGIYCPIASRFKKAADEDYGENVPIDTYETAAPERTGTLLASYILDGWSQKCTYGTNSMMSGSWSLHRPGANDFVQDWERTVGINQEELVSKLKSYLKAGVMPLLDVRDRYWDGAWLAGHVQENAVSSIATTGAGGDLLNLDYRLITYITSNVLTNLYGTSSKEYSNMGAVILLAGNIDEMNNNIATTGNGQGVWVRKTDAVKIGLSDADVGCEAGEWRRSIPDVDTCHNDAFRLTNREYILFKAYALKQGCPNCLIALEAKGRNADIPALDIGGQSNPAFPKYNVSIEGTNTEPFVPYPPAQAFDNVFQPTRMRAYTDWQNNERVDMIIDLIVQDWKINRWEARNPALEVDYQINFTRLLLQKYHKPVLIWNLAIEDLPPYEGQALTDALARGETGNYPAMLDEVFSRQRDLSNVGIMGVVVPYWNGTNRTARQFGSLYTSSRKALGIKETSYYGKVYAAADECLCDKCSAQEMEDLKCGAGNLAICAGAGGGAVRCTLPQEANGVADGYRAPTNCVSDACVRCNAIPDKQLVCSRTEDGQKTPIMPVRTNEVSALDSDMVAALPNEQKCLVEDDSGNYTYFVTEGKLQKNEQTLYHKAGNPTFDCGKTPDLDLMSCGIPVETKPSTLDCSIQ